MKRVATFGLVLGGLVAGTLARAEDKQETLKATVVEPYAEKGKPESAPAAAAKPEAAEAGGGFENTVCTNGKNRRVVELTSGDAAASKPCEVHYKKETEQPGHDQLIWSTVAKMDTCVEKAKGFVDKLTSWGWACSGAKK